MPQKPVAPCKKSRGLSKHACSNSVSVVQSKIGHTASQTNALKSSRSNRIEHSYSQTDASKFQVCHVDQINEMSFVNSCGKIHRDIVDSYSKAVEFVNYWNKQMDLYLKNNVKFGKGDGVDLGQLKITSIPNSMAFFEIFLQSIKAPWIINHSKTKSEIKHTQTANYSTHSKIQQTNTNWSFGYNSRLIRNPTAKSPRSDKASITTENLEESDTVVESPRSSTVNMTKYTCNCRRCHSCHDENQDLKSKNYKQVSRIARYQNQTVFKKNQNTEPTKFSSKHKKALMSPKSTPITVKNMFEGLNGVKNTKNILQSLSKHKTTPKGDSDDSMIPTDEELYEDLQRTDSVVTRINTSQYNLHTTQSQKNNIQIITVKIKQDQKPLEATESDRNVIKSIGIFNENGEIKPDVRQYVERRDLRKGQFRAPRLNLIHGPSGLKPCTSDSIVSDMLSDNRENYSL